MLSGRELETEEILVMVNSAFGGTLAFRTSAHHGVPSATTVHPFFGPNEALLLAIPMKTVMSSGVVTDNTRGCESLDTKSAVLSKELITP